MDKDLIILAYSNQIHNKCKICESEHNHCKPIAKEMYDTLSRDPRLIVILIPDFTAYQDKQKYLRMVTDYSNDIVDKYKGQFKKAIHFSIHTDAVNEKTRGVSTFWYSSEGKRLANIVHKNLVELNGHNRMFEQRKELAELKNTKAISILTENDFHDNPDGAKWIHNNIKKIAYTHCISIYTYLDMRMENKQKSPDEIYKECLFEPEKYQNALLYLKENLHVLPDELHPLKDSDLVNLKCYYHNKNINM